MSLKFSLGSVISDYRLHLNSDHDHTSECMLTEGNLKIDLYIVLMYCEERAWFRQQTTPHTLFLKTAMVDEA